MASVVLPDGFNPGALAHLAGSNRRGLSLEADRTLEVPDVTQPALDAALVDYTANQAQRDAEYQAVLDGEDTSRIQDTFDDAERRLLRAMASVVLDEINRLRTNAGLPARTGAQFRDAIRNKVANP